MGNRAVKKRLAAAVICCLLIGTGVFAAGRISTIVSHSSSEPSVTEYEKIKELEARLQPSSPDKRIILNSFIMSDTPSGDLRAWWGMTKEELEQRHVMCLSNSDAVEKMMTNLLALC